MGGKMSTVSNCANMWVCNEHWLPNYCLGFREFPCEFEGRIERVDKTDKSFQFFFGAGIGPKTVIYVAAKNSGLKLEEQIFNQFDGSKPEPFGRYLMADCLRAKSCTKEELERF